MISKECFVGIINAVKNQFEREDVFCKDIRSAFLKAGESEDFRDSYSYAPATDKFKEDILKSICLDFPKENQGYVDDMIGWFVYECDFGEGRLSDNKPYSVYNYDEEYVCDSPEHFYDMLISLYAENK